MTPVGRMVKALHDEELRWMIARDAASGRWRVWQSGKVISEHENMERAALAQSEARRDAAMRAALLALAEADLPTDIIGAGAAKIAGVRTQHGDGRHLWEARAAFPAMCRAIAEDRG